MSEIENVKEVDQLNLKTIKKWLFGEIEVRLTRLWLVLGGGAALILLIAAVD